MDDTVVAVLVGAAFLCALLGAVVGSPKGLGGIGFVLGLFLGLIGVVIVAVMQPAGQARPSQEGKWWPDPYDLERIE